MNHISIILVFLCLLIGKFSFASSDVEILRQRFIIEQMKPSVDDRHISQLISTIREDGTWPGINYKDVSKTGFQHSQHLNNLVELSRAYKKKGKEFKGDKKLKKVIYSALNYWLANDFILSLIHISEPTRQAEISYAVFCLKKKKKKK